MTTDPFAIIESTPAVSFDQAPIGTIRTGVVTNINTDVQGRNYKTGEPDTWEKSGQPRLSIVITMQVDGEERSLWVTKYSKDAKFRAIAEAQQNAGKVLEAGDTLALKLISIDQANNGQKLYAAKITAGVKPAADSFANNDPPPF